MPSTPRCALGRTAAAALLTLAIVAPACAVEQEAAISHSPPELAKFYRDLQRLEAHQTERVHILQLGDSHTAADVFSGRLRYQFQERFGDAGRGLMPPGFAFAGLRQKEMKISQTGHWRIDDSLKSPNDVLYGLTGFTATSESDGARMTAEPTDPAGFDLASVDFLYRPAGGSFDIQLDGHAANHVSVAGPAGKPGHVLISVPHGTAELGVLARSAGIAFTGWSVEGRGRGLIYDSEGVVGASVGLVEHWNPTIMRAEFDALKPSLVVLAFGTNEGFATEFDQNGYTQTFMTVLSRLRQLAPQASFLIIAPPDGQRVDPICARRQSDTMQCRWTTAPALAIVRYIQRNAAIAAGSAYWDWSTMMSGPGGIDRWARHEPPLARPDHVHFTIEGYELAADSLFGRIMEGYTAYLAETARRAPQRH